MKKKLKKKKLMNNQRTIKFRAWDKIDKTMCISTSHIETWFEMKNRYELMQFTGLLDKNGKEIYEGDLFRCIYYQDRHLDHIYEVNWNKHNAGFRLKRHGKECLQIYVIQTMSDTSRNEIIGNIYENPELLK